MHKIKVSGIEVYREGFTTAVIEDFELEIISDPYHKPRLWLNLPTDAGGIFLEINELHEILGNNVLVTLAIVVIVAEDQHYSIEFKTLTPEEFVTIMRESLEEVGASFLAKAKAT